MELILEEDWTVEELLRRMNDASVDGLTFLRAVALNDGDAKSQASAFAYEATIPESRVARTRERIDAFLASQTFPVQKANGKTVDARAPVLALSLDGDLLRMTLAAQEGPEAGAREILACLELDGELYRTIFPNRTRTYLQGEALDASSPRAPRCDESTIKEASNPE